MSCPHCQGAEKIFSAGIAERELRDYRTHGPGKTTSLLIDAFKAAGIESRTLLDIGGGVGAIQHELLKSGAAARAISIDASSTYLQTAKQEAQRQGYADRITYHHGDFVELAPQLPQVDIVTLEKVLCCYPNVVELVDLSSARAGELYGIVFPVDAWWMKIGARFVNLFYRLTRNPFRIFIHSTQAIEAAVRTNGLARYYYQRTPFWQVIVYARKRV